MHTPSTPSTLLFASPPAVNPCVMRGAGLPGVGGGQERQTAGAPPLNSGRLAEEQLAGEGLAGSSAAAALPPTDAELALCLGHTLVCLYNKSGYCLIDLNEMIFEHGLPDTIRCLRRRLREAWSLSWASPVGEGHEVRTCRGRVHLMRCLTCLLAQAGCLRQCI